MQLVVILYSQKHIFIMQTLGGVGAFSQYCLLPRVKTLVSYFKPNVKSYFSFVATIKLSCNQLNTGSQLIPKTYQRYSRQIV